MSSWSSLQDGNLILKKRNDMKKKVRILSLFLTALMKSVLLPVIAFKTREEAAKWISGMRMTVSNRTDGKDDKLNGTEENWA